MIQDQRCLTKKTIVDTMTVYRSASDESVVLSNLQYTEYRIFKWALISLSEEEKCTYSIDWKITGSDMDLSYFRVHPRGGPRILRKASQVWVYVGLYPSWSWCRKKYTSWYNLDLIRQENTNYHGPIIAIESYENCVILHESVATYLYKSNDHKSNIP